MQYRAHPINSSETEHGVTTRVTGAKKNGKGHEKDDALKSTIEDGLFLSSTTVG
jgi:hypothetical protein